MITSRFASNLFETGCPGRLPANYFDFDTTPSVNSIPAIDILAKFNNHPLFITIKISAYLESPSPIR
jgi:hypothetical protein